MTPPARLTFTDSRLCGVCGHHMSKLRRTWPWWRRLEGRWTHRRCVSLISAPPVTADALPTSSECPSDPPTPTGPQRGVQR